MSAREVILQRIRTATAEDLAELPPIDRGYHPAVVASGAVDPAIVDRFEERVSDYQATVRRCGVGEVAKVIAATVASRGVRRIGVPDGFPAEWATQLSDQVSDSPPLDVAALDSLDGVVTTVALAVAETGTFVLDAGAGQGRRALTLVPDYHLAVVRAEQILPGVPEAVAALDPVRPLTWISGPSATSDIELNRVEGVHGPRTLDVIIVVPDSGG
jgi:L-lactate dehydrogenase complex protein LldG